MSNIIDTEKMSAHLRSKGIDLENRKILITQFKGSLQENDLTEPTNCNGYGRIRHFKLGTGANWPQNPLPIVPAQKKLHLPDLQMIRAQVFQNAVCNWRCWYCFVDYSLLSGDKKHADYFTCDELTALYLDQPDPPPMIDLTGGQPDLTPEWIPWMMEALEKKGLEEKVFLWSDDNLSNDYFWRFLTPAQIDTICNYKYYSRVCCFKGIDEKSFELNTKADPKLYANQFELFNRLTGLGIDLYAYVTLTATTDTDFERAIPEFMDRLQRIADNLPLRAVPLEIVEFSPVLNRMNDTFYNMAEGQYNAIKIWNREIEKRFPAALREQSIADIELKRNG